MMVENDYYELKVDSDLKNLLGEIYPLLDPDLCAQYYIIYAIMGDNGYDAKTIFKERLCDINELIRTSRIELTFRTSSLKHNTFRILSPSGSKYPITPQSCSPIPS
jgi:hypothetical protein